MSKHIKLTTETEHFLFNAYTAEQHEKEKLQEDIADLQKQILELQNQIKELSSQKMDTSQISPTKASTSQRVEYHTDEEDLARETEWIRAKSRKKRKLNTSPAQSQSAQPQNNNPSKERVKKIQVPPPMIVDSVTNYQSFYDLLKESISGDSFQIKMLNGNNVKINAANEDTYRSISKTLTEGKFLWHSFENKQARPIKVIAKNLHFTCKPDRIIEDIQNKGFQIENAVNKLKWKNKEPLNMFLLSFKKEEDINKIYGITSILGCKVEIHPLKSSKLIPQCKRCQTYGHTQKYCSREPRCVKCTGKHLSVDCKKPAEQKPRCVHCGEDHPANYRGCIVAKEMQSIRNKARSSKKSSAYSFNAKGDTFNSNMESSVINKEKKVTYAQVASNNKPISKDPALKKLDEILKVISSFDDRLQKLEKSNSKATDKTKLWNKN